MTGNMRDFIKQMASHKFFENCKFDNNRSFTYEQRLAIFRLDHIKVLSTAVVRERGEVQLPYLCRTERIEKNVATSVGVRLPMKAIRRDTTAVTF